MTQEHRLTRSACRFLLKAAETGSTVTLSRETRGEVTLSILFGRTILPADLIPLTGDRAMVAEVARLLFSAPAYCAEKARLAD